MPEFRRETDSLGVVEVPAGPFALLSACFLRRAHLTARLDLRRFVGKWSFPVLPVTC